MSAAPAADTCRAWLFDLDGTLIDSAPDLHAALNHSLTGAGLDGVDETLVRQWVGQGARVLIEQAMSFHGRAADAAATDDMLAVFLAYYEEHIADRSTLYPGVRATLETLAARGLPMACVTNKYEHLSARVLRALELDGFFGCLIGGDTLPQRKPDPAPLLEACRRLDCPPTQALMVGDSINDIAAARAVPMPVVCVSYGYNHGEDIHASGADAVVDSLQRLL